MAKKKEAIPIIEKQDDDRMTRFEEFLANASKKYGEGAIKRLSEGIIPDVAEPIPSGIIGVDRVTRIGGIPRGRVTEIYGPESSGKTTLMLHIVASAEKRGIAPIVIIDTEFTLTRERLKTCGISDDIIISNPSSGEEALDIAYDALANGAELVCIDSVAGLVPTAEIESKMEDSTIALQARLMSKFLRKVTPVIGKQNRTLIFTNQIRSTASAYGPSEITTGGNALRFYTSLRLELRRKEVLKSGSEAYANIVRVRGVKNKVESPLGEEEIIMYYDASKTPAASLLHTAEKLNLITRNGSYYKYKGETIGAGKVEAIKALLENQELFDEIDSILRGPEYLTRKTLDVSDI